MVQYARVFQSGNSQAVRLPKEFRLDVDRVEVSREGDAIILRPINDDAEPWTALAAAIERGLTEDFFAAADEKPDDQSRPELDSIFR